MCTGTRLLCCVLLSNFLALMLVYHLVLRCPYHLAFTHVFLMFDSTMIQNMIKEGKIVPSEVTIKLLQRAIQENGNDKFLIDGFPRNEENRAAFENVVIASH